MQLYCKKQQEKASTHTRTRKLTGEKKTTKDRNENVQSITTCKKIQQKQ
jgi:hypothetical protein